MQKSFPENGKEHGVYSEADPLFAICALLPPEVREQIERICGSNTDIRKRLSEIRLRTDRYASVTLDGRNRPLSVTVSRGGMADILRDCCRGSVYAYSETLREGYVIYAGCRVGVAGRAVMEDGYITGIDEISSLSFRIPRYIPGAALPALEVWKTLGGSSGMLIYSAPGVGKTTLLRDLAFSLSSGPFSLRVAIVDCRGELGGEYLSKQCMVDILSDYPKAEGIEIATRTLSPQVVICDEIGGYDEAQSILGVQNCGVPIIASAHADSYDALMRRSPVRLLVSCGVFGAFVGVHRTGGRYTYSVDYSAPQNSLKDIDANIIM